MAVHPYGTEPGRLCENTSTAPPQLLKRVLDDLVDCRSQLMASSNRIHVFADRVLGAQPTKDGMIGPGVKDPSQPPLAVCLEAELTALRRVCQDIHGGVERAEQIG
jgi:hypothetical protein